MLTVEEKIMANILQYEALARGTQREILGMFMDARDDIIKDLGRFGDKAIFTRGHQLRALQITDRMLIEVKEKYPKRIIDGKIEVIKAEYKDIGNALIAESGEVTIDTQIPVRRLAKLSNMELGGKPVEEWTNRQVSQFQTGFKRALATSIIRGDSVAMVSRALRQGYGVSRNRIDVLVRTALLQAAKDSRDELYKDNADVLGSFTYAATLDDRTCLICGPDDGRTEINQYALPQPLRHPRCRCFIRANVNRKPDNDGTRPAITETERKTVHHRDGETSTKIRPVKVEQVSRNTTYEKFFKSQPEKWQRQVLGAKRFSIYKENKLSLDGLRASKTSEILTVEQLRKRYS